jgi:cellulose biosynthesis protein BcsQ
MTARFQIVCFASSKGGSGKTVTSSALATLLSALGFSILLIDTDAATNGLTLLFLETLLNWKRTKTVPGDGLVGLFDERSERPGTRISEPLAITERLSLLPASYSMSITEGVDIDLFANHLREAVTSPTDYDFIFLVKSPNPYTLAISQVALETIS